MGTERAALRLALAACRAPDEAGDSDQRPLCVGNAKNAVRTAYELLRGNYMDTGPLCDTSIGDAIAASVEGAESWRHLRARVALYLRAVLRAERDPWEESEEHAVTRALRRTPADLADARDRRVRAEALRGAARRVMIAVGVSGRAGVAAWLRAEADRIERGER